MQSGRGVNGIKRCPESALDESPSGELLELGSVGGVPWFPYSSSDASPTFEPTLQLRRHTVSIALLPWQLKHSKRPQF
ncbi:hypothetical protein OUZ56_033742 [Daphnia magna]|uniref:Uncharacterized protein n=1 Tax=Daphnia magna TaxID=35525 RepID=A0ABQ9ZYE7_9CRUS|nr:hypothetical protein OUZ56_033742 [Daphnia magna]